MTRSLARPPALRPGDRVAVLSISSPARQDRLPAGLDALRFAGLEPVLYDSALDPGSMREYLAGDDALRAGDLTRALTDPSIAGIVFACGGSGAQRTLAALDWPALRELPPKVLAGYSDVTAVLEAVAVKLGWASLFSPMVATEPSEHYSWASFIRTLMSPERATELHYPSAVTVVGGRAQGVTLGGNLCLLAASLGTDTSWPAAGGILMIEDESEDDYRLDRLLTQLRRAGYLEDVRAIVTGNFHECGPRAAISAILSERLAGLGVPMISWADIGHGGPFQTFPIGVAAELDADARTLRLLDPPLIPVNR
ncbi:MAG: LD-carboxypeptidase [Actinomycetota bacterium]|nr:LD-carboxypeptidase [Actinomycetota bacterium]